MTDVQFDQLYALLLALGCVVCFAIGFNGGNTR